MSNIVWSRSGASHYMMNISTTISQLENKVYKLQIDQQGTVFLGYSQDKFEFPYKIYGKDSSFIKRVLKTYENTTGNLGILLNGIKGTGKTVTAEQICNQINLPVILVTHDVPNMCSFFNDLQQDVVIFFDEYEKIFENDAHSGGKNDVLSVMDGVLSTQFRKIFLLTTNKPTISDNMLQRPSRLRYLRSYGDLDQEVILEIIDDKLIDVKYKQDIIEFLAQLEIVTIDIVKSIIEEVNIHDEAPENFKKIFNIKSIDKLKNIYRVAPDPEKEGNLKEFTLHSSVRIYPYKLNEMSGEMLRYSVYSNGNNYKYIGRVVDVIDDYTVLIQEYKTVIKKDEDGDEYEEQEMSDEVTKLKITDAISYNTVFKNFDL